MLPAFSKVFKKIVYNRLQLVLQILLVWLHGEGNQRWLASITIYTFAVIAYPIHNCWNGRLVPATVVVLRWGLRYSAYVTEYTDALYLLCADASLLISAVILCVSSSVLVTRKVSMLLAKPRPKISSFAVCFSRTRQQFVTRDVPVLPSCDRQRRQTYIYIYIY